MSYLGPLGRSSHFRAEKERGRTPGPVWVGTGEAEPQAVWHSFVIMGVRMDISVVLSFHHSAQCTPKHHQITFQKESIFIRRNISHRKLANPSSFQNRCIYLLSRLMTSVLIFLKHLLFSTNNEGSKHSIYRGQENYLQREMSLEIKML